MITLSDDDIEKLQKLVFEKKMEELFEEPSTYEDDDYFGLANIY